MAYNSVSIGCAELSFKRIPHVFGNVHMQICGSQLVYDHSKNGSHKDRCGIPEHLILFRSNHFCGIHRTDPEHPPPPQSGNPNSRLHRSPTIPLISSLPPSIWIGGAYARFRRCLTRPGSVPIALTPSPWTSPPRPQPPIAGPHRLPLFPELDALLPENLAGGHDARATPPACILSVVASSPSSSSRPTANPLYARRPQDCCWYPCDRLHRRRTLLLPEQPDAGVQEPDVTVDDDYYMGGAYYYVQVADDDQE
ncbi:uncharacterized protein [Triticum aestivum]|uniref:uncharacterized protein n=1 Tax=Triticum aestivum TaxID=4565 RepID=UPI001D031317|nr:uncharacterized protein LOC123115213 [Triticum aestivum]